MGERQRGRDSMHYRGRPMFVLSEESQRTAGRGAREHNITAARAVASAVESTLGPMGMDKMLVDDGGGVVITNQGRTVLAEMDIDHPAAEMIAEVAETQAEAVGDGTTTAVVFAGTLLAQAEDVLGADLHPTTVVTGYRRAETVALEALSEAVVQSEPDETALRAVIRTALSGSTVASADTLVEAVYEAYGHVDDDGGDEDDVRVTGHAGGSVGDTRLLDGVVLEGGPEREGMPEAIDGATVALLAAELGLETPEDATYSLSDPDRLADVQDAEREALREQLGRILALDVDAAFSTADIDAAAGAQLAREGVLALSEIDDAEATDLASITGATRVGQVSSLSASDLGRAVEITVERVGESEQTVVRVGDGGRVVTLDVRGGTEHVLAETKRLLGGAVDAVFSAAADGVVPGGGATQVRLARAVRDAAAGVDSREQLAMEAYADALERVPRTLAANAGLDPIDTVIEMRAGAWPTGVRSDGTATVGDPTDEGVFDATTAVRTGIEYATEAATMILRIDDVISAE